MTRGAGRALAAFFRQWLRLFSKHDAFTWGTWFRMHFHPRLFLGDIRFAWHTKDLRR